MSRLERLAGGLEDPLLVTNPVSVRYLTGFESSNTVLVVEPAGGTTLYTDFRYAEAARGVGGVVFQETPRDVVGALGAILAGRRVAVEAEHLTVARWEALAAAGVELVAVHGRVLRLRRVKEAGEVDAIRRAAELSDLVYAHLAQERFVGRTERELSWLVEQRFRELGAERMAFAVTVASAEQAALPHAVNRDAPIPSGTLVIVDAGGVVDGYCSDCTRTFATGPVGGELADTYALCLRAQLDGLAAVRPRVRGREVDAASRVAIDKAGLGWAYGHGLGHGVGLEVHEAPVLRPESQDMLEAGNVVTVEPGLYLPGVGGVRIEDLVLVTEDGCERLTTVTKELVTVS